MDTKKKILILSANPKNTARLRLDEEIREIEEGLGRAKHRDQFIIRTKWAVRLRDLRRAMLDYEPQIVHFCGHGEENGLMVEDENGNSTPVASEALAGLFELFANQTECVLLNACYSQTQAEAINQHINYVIGMNQGVTDKAALEFAIGFYDGLGAGKSIPDAFKLARNAIQLVGLPDHLTPMMLTKRVREERASPNSEQGLPKSLKHKIEAGVYDVFLCYNSQDKPAIKAIAEQLEQHGIRPWLDEWELQPGIPWQEILEKQIEKIQAAAVFIGPGGMGPWQKLEQKALIGQFLKRECPVIPVILEGFKGSPELPLFLKELTWVDFRKKEPDPFEQLSWGITGKTTVPEAISETPGKFRIRFSIKKFIILTFLLVIGGLLIWLYQPPLSLLMRDAPIVERTDRSRVKLSILASRTSHMVLIDSDNQKFDVEQNGQISFPNLLPGEHEYQLKIKMWPLSQPFPIPAKVKIIYYPDWEIRQFPDAQTEEFAHTGDILCVAFSSNGETVISGSADTTLKLWNINTGKIIKTFFGHEEPVLSAAFSPDGKMIISGSMDKTLKLWDVESGNIIQTFSGHDNQVASVAFFPNGKKVISGSADTTLKIWDIETGRFLKNLRGHLDTVTCVAFSSQGKIISGSADGTLKLWDHNGEYLDTFSGHEKGDTSEVFSVAFSPNTETTVISGGADGSLKLWNVEAESILKTFLGHKDSINTVAFSPDGKTILSGSSDTMLKLWDVETGKSIRTFSGHSKPVFGVAFSPKDQKAISASGDATLKLWWVAVEPE